MDRLHVVHPAAHVEQLEHATGELAPLPHAAIRSIVCVAFGRSGKIMRRLLRKIAVGDDKLGDTSTLADPSVVDVLIQHRGK